MVTEKGVDIKSTEEQLLIGKNTDFINELWKIPLAIREEKRWNKFDELFDPWVLSISTLKEVLPGNNRTS